MSNILITGAGAGLGAAIHDALTSAPFGWSTRSGVSHIVHKFDRKQGFDVRDPDFTYGPPPDDLDVLINCAGVNKTGWLGEFADADWDEVLDINAKGIFKMSQWALPQLLRRQGTIINIVSNASHMPMRTSLAYNASKGAAHIMTLQLARELSPDITVFGISPNKLRGTEMSRDIERQVQATRGWTAEQAEAYQRQSLLCGEETDPAQLAEFVAYLLLDKQHHKYLTGCILPYGA